MTRPDRSTQPATSTGAHVAALDGLRGIAALIVVVRHTFNAVDFPISTRLAVYESPLAILLSAQGAVQVFFVLSGYVLAGSLARNRRLVDTLQFYVKRFFRIHPPFVVAVLLAWMASGLREPLPPGRPGLTPWLHHYASIHPPLGDLLRHLAFPGPALDVLPVGWTLSVEMIYSLLLPPLFLLARRVHPLAPLGFFGLAILALPNLSLLWHSIAFCLGLAAYLERDRLGRWIGGQPVVGGLLAFGGLLLVSWPVLRGWAVERVGLVVHPITPTAALTMAVGSVLLVVAAVHVAWFARGLAFRPVRFLGRVSYSLYLVHLGVLLACAPLVGGYAPGADFAKLLAAVLSISMLLAALGYRAVERPSIRLGNEACRWLAERMGGSDLHSTRADS